MTGGIVGAEPLRVLLSLLLALPFACLALLSLLAFLGVMILARMVQAIATARSVMGLKTASPHLGLRFWEDTPTGPNPGPWRSGILSIKDLFFDAFLVVSPSQ